MSIGWIIYWLGVAGCIPILSVMIYRYFMFEWKRKSMDRSYYSDQNKPEAPVVVLAACGAALVWPVAMIGVGSLYLVTNDERRALRAAEERKEIDKAREYLKSLETQAKADFDRRLK